MRYAMNALLARLSCSVNKVVVSIVVSVEPTLPDRSGLHVLKCIYGLRGDVLSK